MSFSIDFERIFVTRLVLMCALMSGLFAVFGTVSAHDLSKQQLAMIDKHALAAPPEVESDRKALVAYLIEGLHTDSEKARAIYRWITDRISYDAAAFLSGRIEDMSVDDVMKKRMSVCFGFSNLFEKMAKDAGLEVKSITGYAKAYGTSQGQHFDKPNHAWNAIRINGSWFLIDSTWGAGYIKNGEFKKEMSEAFFLTPPEEFVFSHFPVDEQWQLQRTSHLSQREFESLPQIEPTFFHTSISPIDAWEALKSPEFSGSFVHTFELPYHLVSILQAPVMYRLRVDRYYTFKINAEIFEKMALVQADHWQEMDKEGDAFSFNYHSPYQGQLLVVGKKFDSDQYTAILAYDLAP